MTYTPPRRAHWQIHAGACGDGPVQCRGVAGCERNRSSPACPFAGTIRIDVIAAGPRAKRRVVRIQGATV